MKQTFIISPFLLARTLAIAYLGAQPLLCDQGVARDAVLSGFDRLSRITKVVHSRMQFLVVCWIEGLSSSLAIDQSPPSVPCHMGLSLGQLTTRQVASIRVNEKARWKPEPFCKFILNDMSHITIFSL